MVGRLAVEYGFGRFLEKPNDQSFEITTLGVYTQRPFYLMRFRLDELFQGYQLPFPRLIVRQRA